MGYHRATSVGRKTAAFFAAAALARYGKSRSKSGGARRKFTRTRTKFQRKRRRASGSIHQGVRNAHGGTWSMHRGGRKLPKYLRPIVKTASQNYFVINSSNRLTATVGGQEANASINWYNNADIRAMDDFVSSSPTQRVIHRKVTGELMITNQDSGNVRLMIYDVVARRDNNNATVSDPLNAWINSYVDEGGTATDYRIVGTTPFSATQFTQWYKVKKITHVTLQQGETHIHKVKYSPNFVLNDQIVNTNQNALKGISRWSFLVYHGVPYNDTVNKNQVSTGDVAIDCVWRKQYQYTFMNDSVTNYNRTDSLVKAFTTAESVMDIGSGLPVTDVHA